MNEHFLQSPCEDEVKDRWTRSIKHLRYFHLGISIWLNILDKTIGHLYSVPVNLLGLGPDNDIDLGLSVTR
jgi:hypothetical protein